MDTITHNDYMSEIRSILSEGISEAIRDGRHNVDDIRDFLSDSWLHETIDCHEFVIYYHKAQQVLELSPNVGAWRGCYSDRDLGNIVADGGPDAILAPMAFFAMQQDVWDQWDDDEVAEAIRQALGRCIADGARGVAGQCDRALLLDEVWQAFCDHLDLDDEVRESGCLPIDWTTEDVAETLDGLSVEFDDIDGHLEWTDGDLMWFPEV